MEQIIKAAGAIVFHHPNNSDIEIVVIHRPRYDDWSFPKGKTDPFETDQEAALREVKEETGLDCEIVTFLGAVNYFDRSGRPKEVKYFVMKEKFSHNPKPEPSFEAFGEVDLVHWVTPEEAKSLLSYQRDRELLTSFLNQFK
jgi:8-oxo-dGTP pyrophosphatase MutT (NUDIX family)